jgi:hypothetical protein
MQNKLIAGAAGLAVALAGTAAQAGIQISVTGFDFGYDGDAIFDLGGAGFNNIEDALSSVDFFQDGVLVGSLGVDDGITINTFFEGVNDIPVAGGVVSSASTPANFNFFDLSFDDGLDFLFNDIADVQVFYSGGEIGVTGVTSNVVVFDQDLPFGLELDEDEPVVVSFSGLISDLTDDGTFVTGFEASGTAEIRGEVIPEPASLSLLAGAGALLLRRRK